MTDAEIEEVLMTLCLQRGAGKSICPSEAARALSDDWRPLMAEVRRVGAGLVAAGRLRATQKGAEVDPLVAKGPIRFSQR